LRLGPRLQYRYSDHTRTTMAPARLARRSAVRAFLRVPSLETSPAAAGAPEEISWSVGRARGAARGDLAGRQRAGGARASDRAAAPCGERGANPSGAGAWTASPPRPVPGCRN